MITSDSTAQELVDWLRIERAKALRLADLRSTTSLTREQRSANGSLAAALDSTIAHIVVMTGLEGTP